MLKIIRKGAIENPWLFKIIMLIIAVTFIATMGWMGLSAPTSDAVAEVNDHKISLEAFVRGERNAREFYRNMLKENYNEDLMRQLNLKKQVMEELIQQRLWLDYAKDIGIQVTDEEIRNMITQIPAFQAKGRFNPSYYKRFLNAERLSPEQFEQSQRESLIIQKAKEMVRQSVVLTGEEAKQNGPSSADGEGGSTAPDLKNLLLQKQQRALLAFSEGLKGKAEISIKEGFLTEPAAPSPSVALPFDISPASEEEQSVEESPSPDSTDQREDSGEIESEASSPPQ